MDPYKVLDVSENASDEEIKKVYRELVKKYHPDRYRGDPMEKVAEEKIREINAAYDRIQAIRSGKADNTYTNTGSGSSSGYSGTWSGSGAGTHGSGGQYSGPYSEKYAEIIKLIQSGYIIQAYSMLMAIPENARDGVWYYLMGTVYEHMGRYSGAYNCYRTAYNSDPSNETFRYKAEQFERVTRAYADNAKSSTTQSNYCVSLRDCCLCSSLCMGPLGGPVFCCC